MMSFSQTCTVAHGRASAGRPERSQGELKPCQLPAGALGVRSKQAAGLLSLGTMQCGGPDKSEAGCRPHQARLTTLTFSSPERSVGKESVLPGRGEG